MIECEEEAKSLETHWEFGIARLNHFIKNEWSPFGAFSAQAIDFRR